MHSRIAAVLVGLAVIGVAPAARAADFTGSSFNLEVFGGWQDLNYTTPGQTASSVISGSNGTGIFGGDAVLKASIFGFGLSLDKTLSGASQPWAGSVLLGVMFDVLPSLRLYGLGEVGRYGPTFGDMFTSSGQTFLGIRPGFSVRLLPSPIRIGAAALIRWPTSGPNADFGSPNYGFIGTVGLEFP